MKWFAVLALAVSAVSSFAADSARGTLHFGKISFEPADAVAFQDAGPDGKPVTIVAFTDFKIDRQGFLDAIQPIQGFLDQINAAHRGNFVLVRLSKSAQCGVGALLGDGQKDVDLGNGFPAKWSVGASRVAGKCSVGKPGKMFDDAYDFDLTWDQPLTVVPKPTALAAGGGEAGEVFASLVKAIQSADWNAAHLHLRPEEVPQTAPKSSAMKSYFEGLGLNYPKTVTITGGLMKGSFANLDIKGTNHEGKKIRGVVMMKRTGTNWRVVDQSLFFDE